MTEYADQRREETKAERLDRNLGELLQELRVALPGIQVLFAFLLTVPFQQGFSKLNSAEKSLYAVTLLSTALAAAMFIAPTAYHRLTFHLQQKDHLLRYGNRLAIAGLGVLALAMTGAILLVISLVFSTVAAFACAGAALAVFSIFWLILPLRRRFKAS